MTTQLKNFTVNEQFDKDGYFILKGFLEPSTVEQAREALSRLVHENARKLVDAGVISDLAENQPFETRLFDLYRDHLDDAPDYWRRELHLAGLYNVFFNPPLLTIIESILGPEIRLYPNYTVRPKLPGHAQALVLWHQDGGYTEKWHKVADGDVRELSMVNIWAPLVPATVENGCMQFIRGTHRIGLLPHEQREFHLEIPSASIEPYLDNIIDVEMDPGDVVVFHNMLCHRAHPNRSDAIRWSMDWRYQNATQPTLRDENGHLARSQNQPESVVASAERWQRLTFC